MSEDRPRATVSQPVRRRRTLFIAVALVALAAVALISGVFSGRESTSVANRPIPSTSTPTPTFTPRSTPAASPEPAVVPTFNLAAHSIDDPTSIWVVVNKKRSLDPADYVPLDLVVVQVPHTNEPELRQEASEAVAFLFNAASAEAGLVLASNSAYRSYDAQVRVYNQDVASNGQAYADTSTARPGFSEHQTGLTIDIGAESGRCSLSTCFGETAEGQWLAANAWRFGFLLRYPADQVQITGYEFEPWHFRYVGVDLATEMHHEGVTTLEEFFGLPAAPSYD